MRRNLAGLVAFVVASWSQFAELLRWIRYSQSSLSVYYHECAVTRAKEGLAAALNARDAARARIVLAGGIIRDDPAPSVPAYLLRGKKQ
jgi:hypothetical protein